MSSKQRSRARTPRFSRQQEQDARTALAKVERQIVEFGAPEEPAFAAGPMRVRAVRWVALDGSRTLRVRVCAEGSSSWVELQAMAPDNPAVVCLVLPVACVREVASVLSRIAGELGVRP